MKTRNIVAIASLIAALILGSTGISFAAGVPGQPDQVSQPQKSCCNYMAEKACSDESSAANKAVLDNFERNKAGASAGARVNF